MNVKLKTYTLGLVSIASTTILGVNHLPAFSQNSSVVGCWRYESYNNGVYVRSTVNFKENGNYERTLEASAPNVPRGNYESSGTWSLDQGYIIVKLPKDTVTFQLISPYEMRRVGSAARFSRC